MCLEDLSVVRGLFRAKVVALVGVIAVSAPLGACGGESDEAQTTAPAVTGASADMATAPGSAIDEQNEPSADPVDDETAIADTLDAVLAGDDPVAACGELVTDRFLRRSYGDMSGCEAALKSSPPAKSARVVEVVVQPDSVAQAMARPKGGLYAGQRLRAELILVNGSWKLDSLRSNVPVGP